MNLEELVKNVRTLATEIGGFILAQSGKVTTDSVEVKGLHDFVTYVDREAEQRLVQGLRGILPGAGFITEEDTDSTKGDQYTWVVDPLDGTTNFIHAIPCYAISIALMDGDAVVLGLVYEINMQECFYAWKGSKGLPE